MDSEPAIGELLPGMLIGQAEHASVRTGVTVVLCPEGASAGVAVRGGAPGTRETELLKDANLVDRVNAIVLTGGSAFGLACVDGVMRWLRERGFGWPTASGPVPIVPAAVLFDLRPDGPHEPEWPDMALGYQACEQATNQRPREGRVGAGAGATVGKILGVAACSLGGVGYATRELPGGVQVGALVVVNAFGHVVDPGSNTIVAGPRLPDGQFGDTVDILLGRAPQPPIMAPNEPNTTLGVIWTNASLRKSECNRVADIAHNGLARTIRPVHTQYDGDTLFMLSVAPSGAPATNLTVLGVAAAEIIAEAVVRAVHR
jgi:L-aminopeptidase/D-esterase-like protein